MESGASLYFLKLPIVPAVACGRKSLGGSLGKLRDLVSGALNRIPKRNLRILENGVSNCHFDRT